MSVNSFAYYGSFVTINGFLALLVTAFLVPFIMMASNPATDPAAVILVGFIGFILLCLVGVFGFFFNSALLRSDLRPVK